MGQVAKRVEDERLLKLIRASDEEHHAIHHAEAQTQSERDKECGGATAGAGSNNPFPNFGTLQGDAVNRSWASIVDHDKTKLGFVILCS